MTTRLVTSPSRRLALLAALLTLAGAGGAVARQAAFDGDSPAVGRAQVVTQAVAEMPDREVVWRIVERTAPPRGEAASARRPFGFILASDEPVLLSNIDAGVTDDVARLATGEAYQVDAGTRQVRASLSDVATTYVSLELVPADRGDAVGDDRLLLASDPFTPPSGDRDVDLVRNALGDGDTGLVPDTGESVFILATDGAIDVLPALVEPVRLQAGEGALVTGEVEITVADGAGDVASTSLAGMTSTLQDAGELDAGYVVIVIGVEVPPPPTATATAEPTATPTATTVPSETPVPTVAVPPTDVPAPDDTPTEVPPPTDTPTKVVAPTDTPIPTPTEIPPPPDLDGDGLSDDMESQYGTSPRDPDSDDDGLIDGDEVFVYGTNPTNSDSDDDGLSDGEEILVHGTLPLNPNTDGDDYSDGVEVGRGWDPLDPDDPGGPVP